MSDLDLLEVVRWEEGVNDSEIIELWHTGLDKILEEVDRLTERPALIEVPEVRETFLRYIRNFCELFESDESVEPSGDLVEDINKTLYETHRSTYNEERVPWHQFLHQYAPGSNAKSMYQRECIDVGIRQMVPPAGLRLLCAWEQEYRDIEQLVNPVSLSLFLILTLQLIPNRPLNQI